METSENAQAIRALIERLPGQSLPEKLHHFRIVGEGVMDEWIACLDICRVDNCDPKLLQF